MLFKKVYYVSLGALRVEKIIKMHCPSNCNIRDFVIFWPDLATCHYANVNQVWMKEQDLYFIAKEDNPPATPQIRPIEQFWSMLKNKVYANN